MHNISIGLRLLPLATARDSDPRLKERKYVVLVLEVSHSSDVDLE